jgi:hypothetical protein
MQWKRYVLAVALAGTVLMILFPPTLFFIEETAEQAAKFRFEYMFIFSIPDGTRINGILLLSQWFGLLLITAILLTFFETSSGKSLLPIHDAESDAEPDTATEGDDKDKEKQEQK